MEPKFVENSREILQRKCYANSINNYRLKTILSYARDTMMANFAILQLN